MGEKFYYSSSQLAAIIRSIALIIFLIGGIGSFVIGVEESLLLGFVVGASIVIFCLLLYSLGAIIELLHDIRENTEHIRDKLEGE